MTEINDALFAGVDDAAAQSWGATWRPKSAAEIARDGVPKVAWDVETLLPCEDGPAIWFGAPGALKSWLALHLAGCIARGHPFLGHFRVRRRQHAIFVNLDAGRTAFERRVLRLGLRDDNMLIVSPDEFEADAFRELFRRHPGAFVVIDTFADAYSVARGDDPAESMRRFIRELRALYQRHGCNGVIVDHPRRPRDGEPSGDYYGSNQKEATARIMWQMTTLPRLDAKIARSKITCRKMSEAEPFHPFVAQLDFSSAVFAPTYDGEIAEIGHVANGPTDTEIVMQVLRGVPEGMTRAALVKRTGLSRDRVLSAIRASGEIVSTGRTRSLRYVLKDSYAAPDELPYESEEPPSIRTDSFVTPVVGMSTDESAHDHPTPDSYAATDESTDESEELML